MTHPDPTTRTARPPRRPTSATAVAGASFLLLGLVAGLIGGVAYAWLVAPISTTGVRLADLAPAYQREYIYMVSQAYAADGDWAQAEARLAALQQPAIAQQVVAELEEALRQGAPVAQVRDLAQMAEQLGAQGDALALFAPTPEQATPTAEPSPTAEPLTNTSPATPTLLPTPTPPSPPTATLPPTSTPIPPTATPRPTYRLLSQQQLCRATSAVPLLEVTVVDRLLADLPAAEIVVSWEGGSDRFLTGFKAGKPAGYGDFEMVEGVSYGVSLGGEAAVGGLRAERCESGGGWQHWVLQFQYLGE